jgi:hypothetical protein
MEINLMPLLQGIAFAAASCAAVIGLAGKKKEQKKDKKETAKPKKEAPAPKKAATEQKKESPAPRKETSALKRETPAEKRTAQKARPKAKIRPLDETSPELEITQPEPEKTPTKSPANDEPIPPPPEEDVKDAEKVPAGKAETADESDGKLDWLKDYSESDASKEEDIEWLKKYTKTKDQGKNS